MHLLSSGSGILEGLDLRWAFTCIAVPEVAKCLITEKQGYSIAGELAGSLPFGIHKFQWFTSMY